MLSIIIPVYNKEKTIEEIISKVNSLPIEKEILVVNDCSKDRTAEVLRQLSFNNLKVIHHASTRGKGAALRSGLDNVTGEFVIVQEADLEYDPNDYLPLLEAINSGKADIVLGSRFAKGKTASCLLTGLMNKLFGVKLNDCFNCYKLMRRESILGLGLKSGSFDIEIEILAKAIKKGMRILEIPVSPNLRSHKKAKMIGAGDAIWAIMRIVYFKVCLTQ
jgi:glycosyltransferase involved in cell wall biosynthesis